jgi:hypothetical protein
MSRVLDMRVYRLHHGRSTEFVERFEGRIVPLLERHAIDIVHYGQSLVSNDCFCMMRAFDSVEQREKSLDAVRDDREWLAELEPIFHDIVVTANTVVLPAEPALIEALKAGLRKTRRVILEGGA